MLVNRTVRLEPHPLDSVGTGTETHHKEAELPEMDFAGTNDGRWDTDVVVTPSELAKGQDDATEPELTAADLRDAEGSWLRASAP